MKHSPGLILIHYLAFKGLGKLSPATPWPMTVNNITTTPDDLITMTDTAGIDEGKNPRTMKRWQKYGVQLRVRSQGQVNAWDKIQAIVADLDQLDKDTTVAIAGYTYVIHNIRRMSPPHFIGYEEGSSRPIFTANFILTLQQTGSP